MAKIKPNEPCPCGSGKEFAACHGPKVIYNLPVSISQRIALKIIPEPDPDTRSVFIKTGDGTIIFQGYDTSISLDCGKCSAPLVVGLAPEQVVNIVFKCNQCGSFNETAN
jgi:hypothetical protein